MVIRRTLFYAKIYLRYLGQYLKGRLSYRFDFLIQIMFTLKTQMVSLIFLVIIFSHVPDINGWSYGEIVFIYGFAQTSMALYYLLFSNLINMGRFYLLDGNLDRVLLRPISPLFQILIERLNIGSLPILVMGIGVLSYAYEKLNLSFSIFEFVTFIGLVFSASLTFSGLIFIFVNLTFWVKDPTGGITWPLMAAHNLAKYPITIYSPVLQVLLSWILPLAFTSFYPATLFLERSDYILHAYMTLPMAIILWGVGAILWNLGLKKYESSGS